MAFSKLIIKQKTDTCKEVGWIIRVISSDTLGFLKDTSKEDSEKALKDSWEISEQGRADKAKKARKKHLITILKEKGETLTEEQEKLLKEIRERKLTTNITSHLVEETKKIDTKAKGNSKVDLKKKEIIQAVVVQPAVNLLDMNKPNPKIEDHSSRYIKDFLEYCYEDRTKIQNNELVNSKKNFKQKILCQTK